LETDVVDVVRPVRCNLRPGAMALPAEIRELFGAKSVEALHEDRPAAAKPFDMRQSGAMAALAGNTRSQILRLAESVSIRTGRVAAEAVARAVPVHQPAGGLLQIFRLEVPCAHRQVETIQCFVEAHAALIHFPVALENIRLPGFPQSEGILDRHGNSVLSVCDGIKTLRILALNPVSVNPLAKRK